MPPSDLVLAVLAHDRRECLEDQLENLRTLAPDADVVVFDGGRDAQLTSGLAVDVCPYSRPLTHHRVGLFHGLVMQWLLEQDRVGSMLVTLDSDMLLLKPGLAVHLSRAMAGRGYLGAHFGEVLPDTAWRPGRRFHRKWPGAWQDLFGLPHPYRSFNPGQVFHRDYVDAFRDWPRRAELMRAVQLTRLDALDEIVWPTLAVSMGVGAGALPGDRALQLRRHSPVELADYLGDPDVFLVHRVGMDLHAPDRALVRAAALSGTVDASAAPSYAADASGPTALRRAMARMKDAYQAASPAARRGP